MEAATLEKITFAEYDPAEIINDKEDILVFLESAIAENDPEYLLRIIGAITRSQGMTQIAKELGIDRAGLYKSLAPDGNPSFKTVFKLLDILGFQLKMELKQA